MSRILDDLPAVLLLVTSRVPLRRRSEQTIAVPPLDVPAADASPAEIEESPAVQMFLRIAHQADRSFDLDGRVGAVAEVCRLLDGVPLALELAAARVRLVGLDGLRESLESGLELLRTTAPDVPERQRVLASTIAWSHDRLGDGARQLCRRLAVFEQAFTLEAVEAVAADAGDVIELLTQVMETGLIRPLIGRIRIGFVMPATVRTFIRRLVPDPRENDPARLALAAYLLDHVGRWQADLDRAEGPLALARFLDVGADVHASVEAALRLGRIEEGVALTLASGPFWVASGELRAGLARTRDTLRFVAGDSEQAGRLQALAGQLAYHLNDDAEAMAAFERAIAIAEACDDEATVATSRCFYASALLVNNEVERGSEVARLGAEAAARLGLYPLVAEGLGALAIAHAIAGEYDAEREMHLARLAVAREHGDVARTADALTTLAEIALDEADGATARAYAEEALAIAHPSLPMEARDALVTLARAEMADGERARRGPHAGAGAGGRGEDRSGLRGGAVRSGGRRPSRPRGAGPPTPCGCTPPRSASRPRPSGTDEPVEGGPGRRSGDRSRGPGGGGVRARVDPGDLAPAGPGARAVARGGGRRTGLRQRSARQHGRHGGAERLQFGQGERRAGGRRCGLRIGRCCARRW